MLENQHIKRARVAPGDPRSDEAATPIADLARSRPVFREGSEPHHGHPMRTASLALMTATLLACGDKADDTADETPDDTGVSTDTDTDADTDTDDCEPSEEVCDGVDNDCDGDIDEDAADATTWYADNDGDGFGVPDRTEVACTQPSDHAAEAGDCDDDDDSTHPGADETCDGVDEDCDGTVDEDAVDMLTVYPDADADGFGDPDGPVQACDATAALVEDATDCDDSDAAVNPDADEVCDGADNDCDGDIDIDDDGVIDLTTFIADLDGDGYGDPDATTVACEASSGWVSDPGASGDTDCDDTDGDTYPGAPEICGDGVAQDCDATDPAAACDTLSGSASAADAIVTLEDLDSRALVGGVDVTGDGIGDLVIGDQYLVEVDTGSEDDGYYNGYLVFPGPLSGTLDIDDAHALLSDTAWDGAGYELGVTDVDGDAMGDLLLSDLYGEDWTGAVYLQLGPLTGDRAMQTADATFTTTSDIESAGSALAIGADQDADGVAELLIGAFASDTVWVAPGDASGDVNLDEDADAVITGEDGTWFGEALDGDADLDGDGIADLVVGAPKEDGGTVYVFAGPVSGGLDAADAGASMVVDLASTSGGWMGFAVQSGDFDGDGQSDLAASAPKVTTTADRAGSVYVFSGPLSGALDVSSAAASIDGASRNGYFGGQLDAHDIDEDGQDDLVAVETYQYATASSSGSGGSGGDGALFLGTSLSGALTITDADVTLEDAGGDAVGLSADLGGDSWGDILMGDGSDLHVVPWPGY
jgi:hypothetical protein